jgi:hypothetical protein
MKKCKICGEVKALEEFYKQPTSRDGHDSKCKICTCKVAEERRIRLSADPAWLLREAERHRAKTAKYIAEGRAKKLTTEKQRERLKKHRDANPLKNKARNLVNNSLKRGDITSQPCWCEKKAQAHHDDYSKPLDVIWLCRRHHADRHNELSKQKILAGI